MSSDDGVSDVIPAHNAARFIEISLAALDLQTVRPLEVIVVDDGSSDATASIAEGFAFSDGTHPRVIRHERPLGVAAARNHGVAEARGTWVGLCDSDDLWHSHRVEAVLELASRRPDAVAIASDVSAFALDTDREELSRHQRGAQVNTWVTAATALELVQRELSGSHHDEIVLADLQNDIVFATTSACYRRTAYAMAGGCGRWSDLSDDYVLNVAISLLGPVLLIRSPHVLYRVRPNSLSHTDARIALGYLAANTAMRLGTGTPDLRSAGRLYRHLLLSTARARVLPFRFVLGFALLGGVGLRGIAALYKAWVAYHVPSGTRSGASG
jgi:glycosyltransferase involved in cell wall biosynthesis